MKKYGYVVVIIVVITVVLGIILFTNKSKDVKIDVDELTKILMQNIKFEDEMNLADSETIKILYNIDNAITQKVYLSSGATAEEIAIFEFKNKNEANEAIKQVNTRIENQKESFRNYLPKEMSKLENAIIIKKNQYIIMCVTEDENGQNIIESYIK